MANKNIYNFIVANAPVKLSEVCAALKVKKYNVTDSVACLTREVAQCPHNIVAEQIEKDILYTVKPSAFALAQQFIRSKRNVLQTKRAKANAGTRKTNASHG